MYAQTPRRLKFALREDQAFNHNVLFIYSLLTLSRFCTFWMNQLDARPHHGCQTLRHRQCGTRCSYADELFSSARQTSWHTKPADRPLLRSFRPMMNFCISTPSVYRSKSQTSRSMLSATIRQSAMFTRP